MALVRRLGRISYPLALDLQLQLIGKYKDTNRGEVSKYILSVSIAILIKGSVLAES